MDAPAADAVVEEAGLEVDALVEAGTLLEAVAGAAAAGGLGVMGARGAAARGAAAGDAAVVPGAPEVVVPDAADAVAALDAAVATGCAPTRPNTCTTKLPDAERCNAVLPCSLLADT